MVLYNDIICVVFVQVSTSKGQFSKHCFHISIHLVKLNRFIN